MDRLTARTGDMVAYMGKHSKLPGLDCAGSMRVGAVRDVMQRLADYEDTGLTPEEVVALRQYLAGAVEQIVQRLVELAPQLVQVTREAMERMTSEQIMELLQGYLLKN